MWQPAAIPKRLQRAGTNLQRMADILIIHPLAHTPAITLAIDTIHSLNELPESQHELLKGLFLNADTFDFSKMWDMSHFFKLDLRLKTNQTRKFTLNLS